MEEDIDVKEKKSCAEGSSPDLAEELEGWCRQSTEN
jgi:hypothetical protein